MTLAARVCLLAAGNGTRAGGPKVWRMHQGKTLLERQLDFLSGLFPPASIAVSIQEIWMEKCRELNDKVRWIAVNPDASPLASLLSLLRPSRPSTTLGVNSGGNLIPWAFVYHVDMPVWERDLWELLALKISDEFTAVVPSYQGKGGHPVLLSPQAQTQACNLDPLRDRLDFWLRGQKVRTLEVPYRCILENWNSTSL
jgi:CTP:molybdopterin cytidylyltransferase MocA